VSLPRIRRHLVQAAGHVLATPPIRRKCKGSRLILQTGETLPSSSASWRMESYLRVLWDVAVIRSSGFGFVAKPQYPFGPGGRPHIFAGACRITTEPPHVSAVLSCSDIYFDLDPARRIPARNLSRSSGNTLTAFRTRRCGSAPEAVSL
jgi:hypothetical protein